ncbi:hypothetical protein [Nocardia yamanashiensis]|uniref:hypothetical protein n=1 Tax=Nocardia yamanashiensis TaxID=209247 RepID=UPI00082ED78A|nr:hypothetical protein [Nocardia yamanashiensis]
MISATGSDYYTIDGLAVLGPRVARVKYSLDAIFRQWANDIGAQEWELPSLLTESQLTAFDYFDNFPHLAVAATPTMPAANDRERLFIASAACYGVYAALADTQLDDSIVVTVSGRCCRNEREYRGLRRLHHFTMRELIALGSAEHAATHLGYLKPRILALTAHLGLAVRVETATDPFFDPNGSRAVMQRLLPVKEEVLTDDDVAIASFNSHRNFFGDRARIRHAGDAVHTSCVAFGLERWIHALDRRYDGDWAAAAAAVESFRGGAV